MLSICIPAFTYVDYTAEAVRSILQQDVDVELVVVEDFDLLPPQHIERSRIKEVRDLLASDARIRWVSANVNRPIQKNWNFTVEHATRKYIKVMGADDRMRPYGLQSLLAFLTAHPATQFLGHLGVVIDDEGQVLRRMTPYVKTKEVVHLSPQEAVRLKLRQFARFREPACNVFSKEVWKRIGGYSVDFRFCFDVHFNMRAMAAVNSTLVSEEWCELRRHAGSDGAKLPAELALTELETLVDLSIGLIGNGASRIDREYAQALVAYRVIELALARANGSPWRAMCFMLQNRSRLSLNPRVHTKVAATLLRRLSRGDVQLCLNSPVELHRLK